MAHPTRRTFCLAAAATLLHRRATSQSRASTHPDVAAVDHDRILASAATALAAPITPITTLPTPHTPGAPHDFYSEPDDTTSAFTAHRDALFTLGTTVAALTAASVISPDPRYPARAAEHLRAWFLTPATRMNPTLQLAHREANAPTGRPEGVLDGLPLAEIARSLRFLASSEAFSPDELAALRKWFADYAAWLNDSRTAGLARDMRDHHASSWLLQAAACADANVTGLTSDDTALNLLRHRFRTVTLRAQIVALGYFPREVSTPNPFRNSLLNLDLLTAACELLTTRFDNPWEFELQDGPGLRNAIAWHFPFMLAPAKWPYPADSAYFKQLPGRRVSLLLAGRAYSRPEYTDLWRSLNPAARNRTTRTPSQLPHLPTAALVHQTKVVPQMLECPIHRSLIAMGGTYSARVPHPSQSYRDGWDVFSSGAPSIAVLSRWVGRMQLGCPIHRGTRYLYA